MSRYEELMTALDKQNKCGGRGIQRMDDVPCNGYCNVPCENCRCADRGGRRERMMSVADELVKIIESERKTRREPYYKLSERIGVHRNTLDHLRYRNGWCTLYVANQILEGLGYELIIRKKKGRENEEGKAE